jgi:hypothetical protein
MGWLAGHVLPQPPQLFESCVTSVQPALQNICELPHSHVPAMQVFPCVQALPHVPQLALSVWRSVQVPLVGQ